MIVVLALAILGPEVLKPPKMPDIPFPWRLLDLRRANEMEIKSEYTNEGPNWVRLYGIDVPNTSEKGYSGARQDLEILLGRNPDLYYEDEKEGHPISRNAEYVQYVWTRGQLIEFEMVHNGWARVNEEGRKGRYGKYLVRAEEEAKRLHFGIWETMP